MRPFFLAAALLSGTLVPHPAASQPTAAFERFADEMVVLGPSDFLHGFQQTWLPPAAFLPIQQFAQFLDDRAWRAGDFLPLLSHRDAKVRTLALVALYNLEDPALLPRVFELVDDARADVFGVALPRWTVSSRDDAADACQLDDGRSTMDDRRWTIDDGRSTMDDHYGNPNTITIDPATTPMYCLPFIA